MLAQSSASRAQQLSKEQQGRKGKWMEQRKGEEEDNGEGYRRGSKRLGPGTRGSGPRKEVLTVAWVPALPLEMAHCFCLDHLPVPPTSKCNGNGRIPYRVPTLDQA